MKLCKNKLHDVEVTGVRVERLKRQGRIIHKCKLCRAANQKRWQAANVERIREWERARTAKHQAVGGRWNYFWIQEARRSK
jgi:hypothetical protein